ncbi:monodechloroaminopyrrolnitrin synthase PrnB family protein [Nocardia ninae]|uniref:monodechloroaminopyrrolnitrin synthase PrnB family protein n=2 Tax=Nocardia ninae TaxID=356145 RepID=UPI001649BBEB|nr:monodechloroaminopyrrolnitrin synthase PrnB family protein [Nocardia ninae]
MSEHTEPVSSGVEQIRLDEVSCRHVTHRDPLSADALLARLPELNAAADVPQLVTSFRELLWRAREIELTDVADRLAAMRDVGMLLSSLQRHGVEPLEAAPEGTDALLAWGLSVDMVPRDTVLHYGVWNPRGKRQRMFLGDREENVIIDAVRVGTILIDEIAPTIAGLAEIHPRDAAFGEICHTTADQLETLPELMNDVYRNVDPVDFYAARLRPFMADVVIADRQYYGPAPVHVPLYLIDRLVWSADHPDADLRYFQHDIVKYALPHWRRLFERTEGTPSLITRLIREFDRPTGPPPTKLADAMDGAIRIMNALVTFRTLHNRMAGGAYTDATRHPTGMAGVSPGLLDHILTLTHDCATRTRARRTGIRTHSRDPHSL